MIGRAFVWSCAVAIALAMAGSRATGRQAPAAQAPALAPQSPCAAALLADQARAFELSEVVPRATRRSKPSADHPRDPGMNVLDALWLHRMAARRGLIRPLAAAGASEDVGDVTVIHDQGDVILRPNAFDLRGTGLRFSRNDGGGYDISRIDAAFRSSIGDGVTLGDDDSRAVPLAFEFPLFGGKSAQAFVNSDGNITFGGGDRASTARDIARLIAGPPRVAPFLSDLDPSSGGRIFVRSTSDVFTVTWCSVPGFESSGLATVQVTMLPDGTIEMKYDEETTLRRAIVGLSPGRTEDFAPVDLSTAANGGGPTQAVGERFSDTFEIDGVALSRRFYAAHDDLYDQLVVWTDSRVVDRTAFAYEVTVANEVRGIGVDVFNRSSDFGSAGRLRSLVIMDRLTKYPDDPATKFKGENSTLSLLGQESGHRWLAFVHFRDHNRRESDALLGRDLAHWSFFFDSDASVMEGNDIEPLGGGKFRTVAAVQRYSRLDQYLMGLISDREVPPFFWVEAPLNASVPVERESDPRVGVTFDGTRRDVLIEDIIDVEGDRRPSAAESSKVHRQAFIYVVSQGAPAAADQVQKLDRIRSAWESFFFAATDGHGRAETRLRPSP